MSYDYKPEWNRRSSGLLVRRRTPVPLYVLKAFYDPRRGNFVLSPETRLALWPPAGQSSDIIYTAQFSGQITSVIIRLGSSDLAVPASVPLGSSVELHALGLLAASSPATRTAMRAGVVRPDGSSQSGSYVMPTAQNPGQTLRFSIMNITVNQAGIWKAAIEYYVPD